MFSKTSRYKNLEDIVTTDAEGTQAESKALRLMPEVEGDFFHTIEEVDRLDHLAYKYYKKPKKWWRICDANPDWMFPPALLGKDPMVTVTVLLVVDDDADEPQWSDLLNPLRETVGVTEVLLEKTETGLAPRIETYEDTEITLSVPVYEHRLHIRYNTMNLSAETLLERITALGFEAGTPEPVGRVGKQIVIPRNTVKNE